MIEWQEEGFVLSARRHGETGAIVEALLPRHGRHLGIVRGGVGRRTRPLLQPGSELAFTWRARLEDHLGAFTVEPMRSRAGVIGDPLALAGLSSLCALLSFALPEREPQPEIHAASLALLRLMDEGGDDWPVAYLRWELGLLDRLGFGLDLSRCAVTGAREGLAFVSPKTGRAVSREGAGDWASRLLALPEGLVWGEAKRDDVLAGLRLTGHFLETRLAPTLGDRPLPPARERLIARLGARRCAAGRWLGPG